MDKKEIVRLVTERSHLEVIEPASLRAEFAEEAEHLCKMYGNGER